MLGVHRILSGSRGEYRLEEMQRRQGRLNLGHKKLAHLESLTRRRNFLRYKFSGL